MSQLFQTLRFRKSVKNDVLNTRGPEATDEQEKHAAAQSLQEGESCSIVLPTAVKDPKVVELDTVLKDWVNETLSVERIIVKDLRDDLYDGQVLQKLYEHLSQKKLGLSDIRQAEAGQKRKLAEILSAVNTMLEYDITGGTSKWSVESIHSKNYVAILYLLVALAIKCRANIRLPEHVSITVFIIKRENNSITEEEWVEKITQSQVDMNDRLERDGFDNIAEKEPEKYKKLQNSLVQFVNSHLKKLNLKAEDMEYSFADGCYLIMLIGQLDGYFVPQYSYYIPADTTEKKLRNVELAMELIAEAGCKIPKIRALDVVQRDTKATLRIIYAIYEKFSKGLS